MSHLADPTTEQKVSTESLLLSKKLCEGNVQNASQNDSTRGAGRTKPARLLTVSYSCLIIVQTWFVFGLTVGYTSPVLSDLEGNPNGNSSAPLDKLTYQDLFSVCQIMLLISGYKSHA